MTDAEEKSRTAKIEVEGETLRAVIEEEQRFAGFDGEEVEAGIKIAEVRIPADPELAEELGHALLGWYAEQQPTGPPGQKPMHQQYAEMEPSP